MPLRKLLETTNTPLAANAEYTTAWYETRELNVYLIYARADVPGKIYLEQSDDGITVIAAREVPTYANVWGIIYENPTLPYCRVRYVNGATPQTSFQLTWTGLNTVY